MRKCIAALVLLFIIVFAPQKTFAQENDKFSISTQATYTISEDGITHVQEKTDIKNQTEFYYTPTYTINLGLKNITNVRVYNSQGAIPFVLQNNSDEKSIEIDFEDRIVGLGKVNSFTLSFDTQDLAKKIGNIWEVEIPGIASPENFSSYRLTLITPDEFGPPAILKPGTISQAQQNLSNSYAFTKEQIGTSGVSVTFGKAQYFDVKMKYHIANSNLFPIKTEIALPPDTNYQKVIIKKLSPSPSDVYQDADGNWLAVYTLSPQKKMDVDAQAIVKTLASPAPDPLSDNSKYLAAKKYWEVDNTKIKSIAKEVHTPREIYDYVVKTLKYNYDKVSEKNDRLGAVGALNNPDFAVCLEFTDLFVALARSNGIPARAVEGYAYTENSKLRPLSLLKDILHAWPEYYDSSKKTWIMVDPTWGNTTKGLDYFDQLDFNHITFVVKGENSSYPIPAGGYKFSPDTKDVEVSFAQPQDFVVKEAYSVYSHIPEFAFSGFAIPASVDILNTGNSALSQKDLQIQSTLSPYSLISQVQPIPPFGKKTITVTFDKTPLFSKGFLTNQKYPVTILFGSTSLTESILVGLLPVDPIFLIGGGIFICGTLLFIITITTWRIFISRKK